MNFRLLAPAHSEIEEALNWYAKKSARLSSRLYDEIRLARLRIAEYPHAWHPLGEDIRRFRLDKFPYGIIYSVNGPEIVIIAFAHLSREPTYWRDRLKS